MIAFFPHIPKSGGTTLLQGFYHAFGKEKCIKVWDTRFGADVDSENFFHLGQERFEGFSAVLGHIGMTKFLMNKYIMSEYNKGKVKIFASVRDPIKRIISLYNYILYNKRHPHHAHVKQVLPLDFLMGQPANYQFHYLAVDPRSSLSDIFKIMSISPIENSIPELGRFLYKNFGVALGQLQIRNKSTDWAKEDKVLR